MVFDKVKKIIVDQLDVEEDKVTEAASITDDLGADSLDVVDLVMSFEEITMDTTFVDDLGADSLDVFQIIMGIEEEFDIEIPDDQVEKIKTVGDIVKFIEEKVED